MTRLGSYGSFVSAKAASASNVGTGSRTLNAPDKCRLGFHGGQNAMNRETCRYMAHAADQLETHLGRSLTLAASPGVRSSTDVQTIFRRVGNKDYDTAPNLVNPRWECSGHS